MLYVGPIKNSDRIRGETASKYVALFTMLLRISDIVTIALAALVAYWLRFGVVEPALDDRRTIAAGVVLATVIFASSSLYRSWRGVDLATELFRATRLWLIAFAATVVFAVAMKFANELSRAWWGLWFAGGLAGLLGARVLCRHAAAVVRRRGLDLRRAVVVGATPDAARIVHTFDKERWAGIHVHGWFSTPADTGHLTQTPHLGDLPALAGYLEANRIDQVWIALPLRAQAQITAVLDALRHSTAEVRLVPDLYGLQLLNRPLGQIAGLPVIHLQQSPLQGMNRVIKALEDRILASVILLAISPLMLVIALAVKASSPGPVFYRQERVSWNNRTFQMLKFRSMPVDAETATGAVWAKAGESRATRVGAFLRKTSLDELPQFINVLKGEMSIVGPRPERPVFVHKFKDEIPAYMKKHMVKAGITGWAQVNGWRGSTDLARRIQCDLHYIENWSLWFDLRIIVLTVFKGFVNKNAY